MIAISLIIAFGYVQAIQFTHKAHALTSTTERVEERAQLTNNNDISCLICYYLQHNHVELFHTTGTSSLSYQPEAEVLHFNQTEGKVLSFIGIRNNKSPPYAYSLS